MGNINPKRISEAIAEQSDPVKESYGAESEKLWYLLYNRSVITMSVAKDEQSRSRKGLGQYYSEPKKPTMVGLTPTAVEQLDELAAEFHLSRSEFIEQIARRMIPVGIPRLRTVSSIGEHDET